MNKTNQFNIKVSYVSPSCKSAQLRIRRIVCVSLGDGYGNGKASNLWDDESVNDYSGDDDLL